MERVSESPEIIYLCYRLKSIGYRVVTTQKGRTQQSFSCCREKINFGVSFFVVKPELVP